MTDEAPDYNEVEYPDLPKGWQWTPGERTDSNYTVRFQTAYSMGGPLAGADFYRSKNCLGGMEGEVYWDEGNGMVGDDHVLLIRPIVGRHPEGDPKFGYNCVERRYSTMQEALNAVPEVIQELYDNHG